MRFHSQNLTDGKLPTWRNGRAWLGRWHAEWSVFRRPGFHIGISTDEDSGVLFTLCLWLFSLYVGRGSNRALKDRTLCVYWFEGSLWLKLWCDDDWHRDRPWHRNTICLHVTDWILGSWKCEATKGEPFPCVIPMPEGSYRAMATPESRTWRRRWGITKRSDDIWLEIEGGGIPFQGKGENSWDCGDDGLCGIGGDTLEEAIGRAVASALKSRRRYGHTDQTRGRVIYARPEAAAQ